VLDSFEEFNQPIADKSLTGIARKLIELIAEVSE
jgi:hypothetical protein